ncbi:MAG TPA: sigma-54 dependent transcriptional regulator [Planctomycetota bacterium]|nr:sigma-54 dependent transcriptional regulator [Planctomycetota bacterium]
MLSRLVLAIEDAELRSRLRTAAGRPDVMTESVRGTEHLFERIARKTADLVLVSRSLIPSPPFDTLRLLSGIPDAPAVVVLQSRANAEEEAGFIAAGCDAVLPTDLAVEKIAEVLRAILDKRRELTQRGLKEVASFAQPRLSDFVSASQPMQAFMSVVERVVSSDVSLLILGETGVGKERLARAIHAESPRAQGPFIAVNCGALPESLLESELFGHEEGAFTGATRARRGWFELAHGGTIFLDEVGEMPLHLQVKLLRVLQEHEIQRVGSERPIRADVRVFAATNRDLEEDVRTGKFRRDLFYRLSVVTLTLPPLRERQPDIPELVDSYIAYLRPRVGRPVTGITSEALDALTRYGWPGNVRELINVIERAMLLCEGDEITPQDLPAAIRGHATPSGTALLLETAPGTPGTIAETWLKRPLAEVRHDVLQRFERAYLAGLLKSTGGRVGETARRAGIRPRSLYDKMKSLGLRKEDFRTRPANR